MDYDSRAHYESAMTSEYPRVDEIYQRNDSSPTSKDAKSGMASKNQTRYGDNGGSDLPRSREDNEYNYKNSR